VDFSAIDDPGRVTWIIAAAKRASPMMHKNKLARVD
jgi:hypothetical protein